MKVKGVASALMALWLALLVVPAFAGSYVGGQLLNVDRTGFCSDSYYTQCDESNGFRLSYGIQFSPFAALEFGYVDGGATTAKNSYATDTARLKSLDVAFVGRVATSEKFNFVFRAGIVNGRDKIRYEYLSCYNYTTCQTYVSGETLSYHGLTLGLGMEFYGVSLTYDVDTDIFDSGSENTYSSTRVASRLGLGYVYYF